MSYGLPKSVEISGQSFAVRYDFRVILTIFEVLDDEELSDEERAYAALRLFFVDFGSIPDYDESNSCFGLSTVGNTLMIKRKSRRSLIGRKIFSLSFPLSTECLGKRFAKANTIQIPTLAVRTGLLSCLPIWKLAIASLRKSSAFEN